MTDLIEQLRDEHTRILDLWQERKQAATALEAKAKEIEALRLTGDRLLRVNNALLVDCACLKARAETAERELDASNSNHRAMAKQLADTGRELDEAREANDLLSSFSISDELAKTGKLSDVCKAWVECKKSAAVAAERERCAQAAEGPLFGGKWRGHEEHNWWHEKQPSGSMNDYGNGRHDAAAAIRSLSTAPASG